ncbi:MAG: proline reductase-associated electron transfer protein PrdC [Sporolactobacillus sp.]
MGKIYQLLLKQGVGNPCVPCVQTGDTVRRGVRIAVKDRLGADLHASVAGKIEAVTDEAILIREDEQTADTFEPLPPGSLIERIRSAGILGMGGAGFPTEVKLGQSVAGGTVIANGAECEPILAHNCDQMETCPEEIYRGLLYAMDAVDAARGILAIKAKYHEAIHALRRVIADPRISIFELRDLYPVGEERALVRDVLGVLLPPDARPLEAQAVVVNVETLSRVTQAVESGRPVLTKNLTVAGHLLGGPKSVTFTDVPIGTRFGDLIEAAGGLNEEYGEILAGGPYMGQSATVEDVVTKTTGGIIVTLPFIHEPSPIGLLVCACGAKEQRMREMVEKMGGNVVAVAYCKHAVPVHGRFKCRNPGICPGQAERVLELKKAGAEAILIGNCSDCSNTVMAIAPKLKLRVHHITDGAMRAMNLRLIRRLHNLEIQSR